MFSPFGPLSWTDVRIERLFHGLVAKVQVRVVTRLGEAVLVALPWIWRDVGRLAEEAVDLEPDGGEDGGEVMLVRNDDRPRLFHAYASEAERRVVRPALNLPPKASITLEPRGGGSGQ